jgi:2-methylcitrate dehydratase PrpD
MSVRPWPGIADHAPSVPPTLTDTVSHFASALQHDDVPADVRWKVKLHLLDTIGCALGGQNLAVSHSARRAADAMGSGHCRVFGSDAGYSPTAAAFSNAVIANALDYDDGVEIDGKGLGHPGASLVCAALAALDDHGFGVHASGAGPASSNGGRAHTGRDLVTALAAGYEINNRLIASIQPSAERFNHAYGIAQHQAVGACIVFGKLAGMTQSDMHNALGLAATLSCVPSLHKYNWRDRPIVSLKDYVAPAAMGGVQAALLGQSGFVGSKNVFDGDQGFWRMMGSDMFDPALLVGGLRTRWFTEDSSFKLYPACRWLASALEAFDTVVTREGIDAEQIAAITVTTFGVVRDKLMSLRPVNEIDAQFSLPYLLGALATRRVNAQAWFTDEALSCPRIAAIAKKVNVVVDPAMDRAMNGRSRRPSASVSVTTLDGETGAVGATYTETVLTPLGSRLRPATEERIFAKARANLALCATPADEVISRIMTIDSTDAPLDLSFLR